MSEMFDVYMEHADLYDELVGHEDHDANLPALLREKIEWKNKTVCEFGVGTGRVTMMYIDRVKRAILHDNSKHMMERAKSNLSAWSGKTDFREMDNSDIDMIRSKYDIVIEGWSFGHLIVEKNREEGRWIERIIDGSIRIADEKVIIIETMGTNVPSPTVPGHELGLFYDGLLKYGFEKDIIETDYVFDSCEEASRIMGGFFGARMGNDILRGKTRRIKEYTGVWIYSKKKSRALASSGMK